MPKRIFTVVLALALLLTPAAVAAVAAVPSIPDELTGHMILRYDQVGELLLAHNPDLVIARMNRTAMDHGGSENAAESQLWSRYTGIGSLIASAESAQRGLSPSSLEYIALTGQIASLSAEKRLLASQMGQIYPTPTATKKAADIQIEKTELQLVSLFKTMYISYRAMARTQTELTRALSLLSGRLDAAEASFALGNLAEIDLLSLRAQKRELESELMTLTFEMDNLLSDFNLMLGREYDAPLEIAAEPAPPVGFLSGRDTEADLAQALRRSFDVRAAREEYGSITGTGSGTVLRNDAALYNVQMRERVVRQSFDRLCRTIGEKERLLTVMAEEYAYKTWLAEAEKAKLELGQISEPSYRQAQSEQRLALLAVQNAEVELLTATERYLDLVSGLSVS